MTTRLIYPISLALCIFIGSSHPAPQVPSDFLIPHLDKFVHATLYGFLAISIVRVSKSKEKKHSFFNALYSFLITGFYGFSDEVHQYSHAFRSFEWMDLIADCVGAAFAIIVYTQLSSVKKLLELRILSLKKKS